MAPLQAAPLPQRYEMLGELGRGGMGIVCKVRDRETGEVLAIKILKPEIAANPQILERFKNELLLAHKITHRHVARLYEFHRAGDSVYLSMEFVEGESLRSLLEREGRLRDRTRALEFARQLAGGLAEAHRQSIVHRDLKPENIMIGPDGELKVMDFGISRSYAEDATVTGSVVGTPAYMAPEQAKGKTLDHRTDIYAFGLVLYEMFTGEAAFKGDTAVTVALKQIRERPRKPDDTHTFAAQTDRVGDPEVPGKRSGGTVSIGGRCVARVRGSRSCRNTEARETGAAEISGGSPHGCGGGTGCCRHTLVEQPVVGFGPLPARDIHAGQRPDGRAFSRPCVAYIYARAGLSRGVAPGHTRARGPVAPGATHHVRGISQRGPRRVSGGLVASRVATRTVPQTGI